MPDKKTLTKTSPAASTPSGSQSSTLHLSWENLDGLTQKIVESLSIDEKITWSWGIISEYQVLTKQESVKLHLEHCEHCRVYLHARRILAEQIIKSGRV